MADPEAAEGNVKFYAEFVLKIKVVKGSGIDDGWRRRGGRLEGSSPMVDGALSTGDLTQPDFQRFTVQCRFNSFDVRVSRAPVTTGGRH